MALISINLAVLNLLPVPVLDGGQFLFLLAEAVIRRPLPLKLRERLTTVGLVLIVLLMGLAFSNDIRRLSGRGGQGGLSHTARRGLAGGGRRWGARPAVPVASLPVPALAHRSD